MNPMSFFQNVFIINLDRRTDRWETAKVQLQKLGVLENAERISGVDTHSVTGCTASHRLCLDRAVANGGVSLILEDDFNLIESWKAYLTAGLAVLPSDWDMLYLGYNLDPAGPDMYIPRLVNKNLLQLFGCLTTHMYALNGTRPGRLAEIKHQADAFGHIAEPDILYLNVIDKLGLKTYGVYPMIATQSDGHSDCVGGAVHYTLQENVDKVLRRRYQHIN